METSLLQVREFWAFLAAFCGVTIKLLFMVHGAIDAFHQHAVAINRVVDEIGELKVNMGQLAASNNKVSDTLNTLVSIELASGRSNNGH